MSRVHVSLLYTYTCHDCIFLGGQLVAPIVCCAASTCCTGHLQPPLSSDFVPEAAMLVTSYLCQWKVPKKKPFKCQQLCARSMIIVSRKREELALQKILTLDQQNYEAMLCLCFLPYSKVFKVNHLEYRFSWLFNTVPKLFQLVRPTFQP